MAIIKPMLHFIVASVVGFLMAVLIMLGKNWLPQEIQQHWRFEEPALVLGSLIGGALLGFDTHRSRRMGLWLGLLLSISAILWGIYAVPYMTGRLNLPITAMGKALALYLAESAALVLCCALAGYCGQLWVGKWKRGAGHK